MPFPTRVGRLGCWFRFASISALLYTFIVVEIWAA
jgi:hypothetical protein